MEIRRKFVSALERKLLPEVALKKKRLALQRKVSAVRLYEADIFKRSQRNLIMHTETCAKPLVSDIIEVC